MADDPEVPNQEAVETRQADVRRGEAWDNLREVADEIGMTTEEIETLASTMWLMEDDFLELVWRLDPRRLEERNKTGRSPQYLREKEQILRLAREHAEDLAKGDLMKPGIVVDNGPRPDSYQYELRKYEPETQEEAPDPKAEG